MTNDQPRRIPAVVTYLHPFRIVDSDNTKKWLTTIDDINKSTWDYVALHEIVGGIDVGLEPPYHLVVGRDGAIALPPIPNLRGAQQSVEFFNRCLAALLLGGIYCEAITLDNLELGSIIDWKYIRSLKAGIGAANQFHNHIRMKAAPALEAIALYQPRQIELSQLASAMRNGLSAINSVPSLAPEFLLKGVTGIARRDWGAALTNLWIAVEQISSFLWQTRVLDEKKVQIAGRIDQLKDNRSWSIAARHELLFQKNVIDENTMRNLFSARKARNELAHAGKHPSEEAAKSSLEALRRLLGIALKGHDLALFDLDLSLHALSDPFKSEPRGTFDPQYWMEIPKLPGEAELEREEAAQSD